MSTGTNHGGPESFVAAFRSTKVLVVGDVMLDEYLWGSVHRISPEAPIPIVDIDRTTYVAGGAGNVAANVTRLGGSATLIGVIGEDGLGRQLADRLQAANVAADGLIVESERPTTVKTRVIAQNQQVVRVDREVRDPISAETRERIAIEADNAIRDVDVVLFSDYGKGVLAGGIVPGLIDSARTAGVPVMVDPKGSDYSKYRRASLITPNKTEAARVTKMEVDGEADLMTAGRALLRSLDGEGVLVTCGGEGMWLFRTGTEVHLAPRAREVFDVTGAGDTVVSVLALAVAAGADLETAACLANEAAGVAVGKVGTATVSPDELIEALGTVS